MSSLQKVRIQSIHEDKIVLVLPSGENLNWPLPVTGASAENQTPLHVGDELVLTLTSSVDVINELLGNTFHA
jgi:hypothetical protein